MLAVSDGRASTDTTVVRVTDRPFVGAISMRAEYPAYLGRAPEGLPVGEPAAYHREPSSTLGRASTGRRYDCESAGVDRSEPGRPRVQWALYGDTEREVELGAVGSLGPIADVPLPLGSGRAIPRHASSWCPARIRSSPAATAFHFA